MALHEWQLTPQQAITLQRTLAKSIRLEPLSGATTRVAGVDCAYVEARQQVVAVAVLCHVANWEIVATGRACLPCRFPYVPGLLSFREAPAVIEAVQALPCSPDLLMCDGQGIAHPRKLGLATHIGLWLDLPTIGVAKSRLCGTYRQPGLKRGCRTQLRLGNQVVGAVVRTRTGVRPLFVSPGHRITLAESIRWALRASRGYRLPEPTRQAHLAVTAWKRELMMGTGTL